MFLALPNLLFSIKMAVQEEQTQRNLTTIIVQSLVEGLHKVIGHGSSQHYQFMNQLVPCQCRIHKSKKFVQFITLMLKLLHVGNLW